MMSCQTSIGTRVATMAAVLVTVGLGVPLVSQAEEAEVLKNPYAEVNWEQVNQYTANLHAHTVKSDGRALPEELISNYADAGYDILAITDHDNYHTTREGEPETTPTTETTWPWTEWVEEEPSEIWAIDGMETSALYPELGERGMLAIRGNELTCDPHIVSLFNDCGFSDRIRTPDAERDHERMTCVDEKGGLAYWAHPGHYVPGGSWEDRGFPWQEAVEYFGGFITEYDCLLGIEMQLGGEREVEEELLDRLLAEYYRDHDIFIKGSDDTHATSVAGDATLTIVLAEELTEDAVRHALKNGHNFVGSRVEALPVFNEIAVDEDAKIISLDIANHDGVTWIANGERHDEGDSIEYAGMEDTVLRFEVDAGGAVFYSQAFYID